MSCSSKKLISGNCGLKSKTKKKVMEDPGGGMHEHVKQALFLWGALSL